MSHYMSDILSERGIQPGTENTGIGSENDFEGVVRTWMETRIGEGYDLEYVPQARELLKIFGDYGVKPEGMLMLERRYVWFFEVKYQKGGGNAQERVYRLFTPGFQNALADLVKENWEYDEHRHPYSAVFTGSLAVRDKYLQEFETCLAPDSYIVWDDLGNPYPVYDYLDQVLGWLWDEKESFEGLQY